MSDPCHQKEGEVIDDGRCENHTVKAVHDSAVAGNEMTVILDAVIPLDGGRGQVTGLADDTAADSYDQEDRDGVDARLKTPDQDRDQAADQRGPGDSADCSLNRLLGAEHRSQLVSADGHSDCQGADIAHR